MENKKISSQYPSRSYGNRQQPEKKVKKAEGQNIFARSGRAVKKKFRIFSIRAGMDMPFFLLIMVILCIGLVMLCLLYTSRPRNCGGPGTGSH